MAAKTVWYKVLDPDELPDGRVVSKRCGQQNLCLSHFEGKYAALDNHCPHQGGPLGEGTIENGWLRCPWHGWDYHPLTGKAPGGYEDGIDTFPVEERDDGVYVGIETEAPHETTISDIMARTLTNWGVRWCFGMVGHSNLGLADGLRRETAAGRLGFVGVRHECAASFAASAYGKLTGRPASCLSIAGPGATNLLTGLWDANVDRAPVVALTGQVQTQVLGRGAFQEIDLKAAFGRVAQFSATVLHHSDHAELASLAVKSAILNEGVSHLIFPDEVQVRPAADDAEAMEQTGRMVTQNVIPDNDQLEAAVALLGASERPCFIVGHGARFQMDEIRALAEELNCPVVTTFKGKGLISDHHPLGCGVLGRSGTPIASWFMNESDLLVVMGSSFAKHTGITPKKPILQIDRDAMVLGKKFPVTVAVLGDIGQTVRLMHQALGERGHMAVDRRTEVAERWSIWRDEKARRHHEGGGAGIHSITVFEALAEAADDDAVICVDVGNNTYSFGRYFESTNQAVLMSGYLGSIGFSLPAAMGAWAATQEEGTPWYGRQVISVSGDGGLGQYLADFTTWVNCNMNITHVVLNNCELGKISKEQRGGNFEVWQTSLTNPSFARYAENCGALGIRVEDPAGVPAALRKAFDHPGPALVEIITDVALV
jgi:pyruvate oxidase